MFTDNLIVEMAGEDSTRPETRKEYIIPEGKILGYGDSHLKKYKRPIILL
jgi:hypothetical protein